MLKEVIISRSFLSPLLLTGEPALFRSRNRDKCWVVGTQNVSKKTSKCESKKTKCVSLLQHRSISDLVPPVLTVRHRPTFWRSKPRSCDHLPPVAPAAGPSPSDSLSGCAEAKSRRIERGRRLPRGRHQWCSNFHLMCGKTPMRRSLKPKRQPRRFI